MSTRDALLSLELALSGLAPGSHVCSIEAHELEPLALSAAFVRTGLERGEQCVYITEEGGDEQLYETFRAGRIDVSAALQSNALVLLSPRAAGLKGDAADPYRMFILWKKLAARAREAGFAALRGTVEMGCVLGRAAELDQWLEYERQLTQLAEDSQCLLLCQYRRTIPAEHLLNVVRSHPSVLHRGTLAQNIYHVAAPEAGDADPHAAVLDSLLDDIRKRERLDRVLRQQRDEEQSRSEQLSNTALASSTIAFAERKRAEEELRRSEAYLADAQRISHTGSWGWDAVSRDISFWSLEHFRIVGLDPSSKATYARFRPLVHPEDLAFIEENFARAVREQVEFEHDFRIIRADGVLRYLRSYGHPVFDESGTLIEYAGTIVDCTEQRQAEAALRTTQAQLARVSRLMTLGELTASIAHEVNQPLAAILAFGDAARRWVHAVPPNVEEADAACAGVIDNARRAREVIARIRSLAEKADRRRALDINAVMEDVLALAQGELRQNTVSVRTEFGSALPSVSGDPVQLQQVGLNLIINAVEAMSGLTAGRRELFIRTWRNTEEIHVAVRDSGVGVPEESMQTIFEPFYTTKAHGVGIGLSISRSIIQTHNGRLWIERNEGMTGITARFALPVSNQAPEQAPIEPLAD